MITIKRLIDCKSAERFGSCHSCCKTADQDKDMVRITISTYLRQGTSICLCENCLNELVNAINNMDRNGDCETCKHYIEQHRISYDCQECIETGMSQYEPYIPKENE